MKKSFIDLCKSPLLLTFFVSVGVVGLFEFVIWPGLTTADTLLNIFSGILGVLTLGFVFYFVKNTWWEEKKEDDIVTLLYSVDQDKEPETELDYNPTRTKGTKEPRQTVPVIKTTKRKSTSKKPKKNGTNKVGLK